MLNYILNDFIGNTKAYTKAYSLTLDYGTTERDVKESQSWTRVKEVKRDCIQKLLQ